MATDDLEPPSVTRASLKSDDGAFLLELVLFPLHEWCHVDWHGYQIHMTEPKYGRRWSLVSTADHTLFLDRAIEPEIPAICAGLRRAADSGDSYRFTPVDERDFLLEVSAVPGGLRVMVQFRDRPAPKEFGWPDGVLVSRESVRRFADELEVAFTAVA